MSLYNYSNRNFCNSNCGCDCNYNPVCSPDKIDNSCSLNSIRKTIIEIINAVKNEQLLGFNVDVEITTSDGTTNTINFSKLTVNSIQLTKTTLIIPGLAISLCDIVKIIVLTSSTTGSSFNSNLLNGIKNITTTCVEQNSHYYDTNDGCNSCNSSADVRCAQGMQNYINQNINTIDTISYNGNFVDSQNVELVKDISTTNVLKSSTINTTNTSVLNNADLETTSISVVNEITLSDTDVVSEVVTETNEVVTDVTSTNIDVSAPITVKPTTVVSEINLTDDAIVVTKVDSTTKNVVNQVSSTTGTVVTGFTDESTITGVISNIDEIRNITPASLNIPAISSTGTGELKVTIKEKSIDGTNPVSDIVLNVTVGGQNISFNGNTAKFVLNDSSNILGGNKNTPNISTVNQIGTPTTDTFTKTVSSTNTAVLDTITPTNVTTKLINEVNSIEINNVDTPTTENVLQTINVENKNIESITNVNSIKPSNLISNTTENVLNSATLSTTSTNALNSATLQNVTIPVVNDITTSVETIFIPIKENIEGSVFAAGDGIMGVNNTNGDITVYSICDINTVNTTN